MLLWRNRVTRGALEVSIQVAQDPVPVPHKQREATVCTLRSSCRARELRCNACLRVHVPAQVGSILRRWYHVGRVIGRIVVPNIRDFGLGSSRTSMGCLGPTRNVRKGGPALFYGYAVMYRRSRLQPVTSREQCMHDHAGFAAPVRMS